MPPPPSLQVEQDHLAQVMSPAVLAAWGLLDRAHLSDTFPQFSAAITAIVQQYGRASAALAARDYAAKRREAGLHPLSIPQAKPAGLEQVTADLKRATQGLWSGDVREAATGGARLVVADTTDTVDAALVNTVGVTEKHVLNAGRDTTLNAVAGDRKARGWARLPEADACSFCLLLATRGAVYKDSSFIASNAKFTGPGDFKVHDHCRCAVEPLFGNSYEPTAQVRAAQALYKSSTMGLSGKAARNAFRRAVDAQRN